MRWEQDLIRDIRFHDARDDEDYAFGPFLAKLRIPNPYQEFTTPNHQVLKYVLEKHQPRTVLEIGVARNGDVSSTYTILNNFDGIYLGVDLEDKTFLNSHKTHTLQTNSSHYDIVCNKLRELGVTFLDMIHIDGWHSINQVLRDWEYVNLLSPKGVVCFHDTNAHPGPYLFTENLNDKWKVTKTCPNDFGFSYCERL